jgi:NADH-quinone oxidoreductase subunit K
MNFAEITLGHYLALSSVLFLIGLAGVILRRSLLIMMMSLELLLNAANLALVAVGRF